ncbi:MAG: hypothetical protein FIB08_04575 [Candidatus Methanoperedens sp.]|nr:hypothetical protein [Candidatus Methanoperedens sp.]
MRTKLNILLLVFIFTAIPLGCIEPQKSPSTNETGSKPVAPPDMGISLQEKNLSIGEKVPVFFNFTPHETITRAIAHIDTEGAIVLAGQSNFSWENLPANTEQRSESVIQITKPGLGILTSTITIENETGQTLYGRSAIIYIYISQREVLVGPISFETRPLKINGTFETWSRGYNANASYTLKHPYFRVITNYSQWIAFLEGEGYFAEPSMLEGFLFPGGGVKPRTINPADFSENYIIAAMMGLRGFTEGPEIEIKNISRINNTINVIVHMYDPQAGAAALSSPYHIVIVKREFLPKGNSTFVFIDTEGKELGKVEVRE